MANTYDGTPVTVLDATATLNSVDLGDGGATKFTFQQDIVEDTIPVWGSYPEDEIVYRRVDTTGSVEYVMDQAVAVAVVTGTEVALVIVATGFYFACATVVVTGVSGGVEGGDNRHTVNFRAKGAVTIGTAAP